MKTRFFLLSVALLMSALSVFGQTCNNHTVTATITDADSQTWNNGSYTVAYYNPSGVQRPVCRNTGLPITTNYSGTMNGSGTLTVSLPDTTLIDPPGARWIFTLQPQVSVPPAVMNPVAVSANINYSSSFSTQVSAIPVRFSPLFTGPLSGTPRQNSFGYLDVEASPVIEGSTYWNVTTGIERVFHTGAWANLAGPGIPAGVSSVLHHTGIEDTGSASVPNLGCITAQTSGTIGCGFVPILQTGAPVATCAFGNRGQTSIDISTGNVYACIALPGPTFQWASNAINANQWNGVTPTNTPGVTANESCLSTGTANQCTWQPVASSSGAMTNITASATFAGCATSGGSCLVSTPVHTIDITGIPNSYNHLQLSCNARMDDAIVSSSVNMTLDGNTNAYFRGWIGIQTGAVNGNQDLAQTSIQVANVDGASGTGGYASAFIIQFPFYKSSTFNKTFVVTNINPIATTSMNGYTFWGMWSNVTPINRITLVDANSGNFAGGTECTLYGIL